MPPRCVCGPRLHRTGTPRSRPSQGRHRQDPQARGPRALLGRPGHARKLGPATPRSDATQGDGKVQTAMRSAEHSNLRRRAETVYREYRAILILVNRLNAQERARVDRSLEQLPRLPRGQLHRALQEVKKQLADLRREFGAKGTLQDYDNLLSAGQKGGATVLWARKLRIQELFTRYERAHPVYASLPPHAWIGIDTEGILRLQKPALTWWLLEAKLYEDMALLWNVTLDARLRAFKTSEKVAVKSMEASLRAGARAAFHLLEGYVNGVAFDILVATTPGQLAQEEVDRLLEWDRERKRPRHLSLRDKLLQYPRIALGQAHPPLQESNCTEMGFLLEKEESLRHRLVHPSPSIRIDSPTELRERAFFDLSIDEGGKLVDAVVSLIRRLNDDVLGKKFGNVDVWLFERGTDGRFPEKAFD